MALSTAQVALNASTPTLVFAANKTYAYRELKNADASINIYIGDANVTTSTGHLLKPGESFGMERTEHDALYAIAASGTPTVTKVEW